MSLARPYIDSYNMTNDTCPYGSLLSTFKGIGDICPKGHFCKSGVDKPEPCPAGQFNNQTGQSVCTICPSGYYCPEGTISYLNQTCPPGFYCERNTTRMHESPCPAGTYNNLEAQKSVDDCLPCEKGRFCAGEGNVNPTGYCAPGWYCSGRTTEKKPSVNGGRCEPGFYCPNGSSAPTPCDIGKFCSRAELDQPEGNCSKGFFCIRNSTTPTPEDGTTGKKCPYGYYCIEGTISPVACNQGTFLDSLGGEEKGDCRECTPGKFCNASGLREPVDDCLPGFYCPAGSISNKQSGCDEGYYCVGGKGFQEPCPSGKYQDQREQDGCETCIEGYYCNATFAPVTNHTAFPCPEGYYCLNGTEYAEQYPCSTGTFNNVTGRKSQSECTTCLGGYYCGQKGLSYPNTLCSEGYFCKEGAKISTPKDGATANICPLGHYCPVGTANPEQCKIGTIGKKEGLTSQTECTDCPEGKFCDVPGKSNYTEECDPGYFCPNGSSRAKMYECTEGNYCPKGSPSPEKCLKGTFSNQKKLVKPTDCNPCTAGFYCDSEGLTEVAGACKQGYYCPEGSDAENKEDCLIGMHCPNGKIPFSTLPSLFKRFHITVCVAKYYFLQKFI